MPGPKGCVDPLARNGSFEMLLRASLQEQIVTAVCAELEDKIIVGGW